jgi:soluble lytic murein transglycosylase
MELLGVGEIDVAARELDALGFADTSAAPELLWGVALLYSRAGSAKLSHALARRILGKSPARYPAGAWAEAWRLAYPEPYQKIVQREATKNAVDPQLIYAIMREESAFDPDAESPADAHGLMQLIVPTAKDAARPLGLPYDRKALRKPEVNITLGVRTLAKYAAHFPQNPLLAIPAYNAGPGNPRRWLKERPTTDFDIWVDSIPFVETRRYTKRVLASRGTYALLYAPETAANFLRLPSSVAQP